MNTSVWDVKLGVKSKQVGLRAEDAIEVKEGLLSIRNKRGDQGFQSSNIHNN